MHIIRMCIGLLTLLHHVQSQHLARRQTHQDAQLDRPIFSQVDKDLRLPMSRHLLRLHRHPEEREAVEKQLRPLYAAHYDRRLQVEPAEIKAADATLHTRVSTLLMLNDEDHDFLGLASEDARRSASRTVIAIRHAKIRQAQARRDRVRDAVLARWHRNRRWTDVAAARPHARFAVLEHVRRVNGRFPDQLDPHGALVNGRLQGVQNEVERKEKEEGLGGQAPIVPRPSL